METCEDGFETYLKVLALNHINYLLKHGIKGYLEQLNKHGTIIQSHQSSFNYNKTTTIPIQASPTKKHRGILYRNMPPSSSGPPVSHPIRCFLLPLPLTPIVKENTILDPAHPPIQFIPSDPYPHASSGGLQEPQYPS